MTRFWETHRLASYLEISQFREMAEPNSQIETPPLDAPKPLFRQWKKKPLVPERWQGLLNFLRDLPKMFLSLMSSDPWTRAISWLFILSLVGFFSAAGLGIQRIWDAKDKRSLQKKELERHLAELEKKTQMMAQDRERFWVKFDSFRVELREITYPGEIKQTVAIGLVEISLRCDSPSTAKYVAEHAVQAQDQVTKAFVGVTRDSLLTNAGKNQIKIVITKMLNNWLPAGRVDEVYFSKLIVN